MGSPIQFQVDLNEIIKKVLATVKDAQSLERDCSDIAKDFHREIAWTEFYDGIIKNRVLNRSGNIVNVVGAIQQAALVDAVNDVYRAWQDLDVLFLQQAPNFNSIQSLSPGPWPIQRTPTGQTTTTTIRPWRGISWALNGKSRAKRIMDQIKLSNQFLATSTQAICNFYEERHPQSISPSLPDTTSGCLDPGPSNSNFSTQIARLTIRRGKTPTDMTLLKGPDYVQTIQEVTFGPDCSHLAYALAAGCKPVLIEHVPTSGFSGEHLDRAVRLAMMLHQPAVDGLAVLPCLGLSPKRAENRFEFIYDLTGPRMHMSSQDGVPASASAILEHFGSLHARLSKGDKTSGQPGILRHYKPHETRIRPISIGQRLSLAVDLAQTVLHLHQANWVHGNITSSNIYLFQEKKDGLSGLPMIQLGKCYLFGFQFARLNEDYSDSYRRSHLSQKDNLYRHPDRQILPAAGEAPQASPQKPHRSHHDIYSLGVILLEIGLGRTAEELVKLSRHLPNHLARSFPDPQTAMREAKSVYILLADNFLPGVMGNSYASATRLCLDGSFGDLGWYHDETAISLPTAFQSAVIEPLVRMLDVC